MRNRRCVVMNLKEAFQVQNKIGELLSYIGHYLSCDNNVMTVTKKHLRSKASAGHQDDTIDVSCKSEEMFEVGKMIVLAGEESFIIEELIGK